MRRSARVRAAPAGAVVGGALFVLGVVLPRIQAPVERRLRREVPPPPPLPTDPTVDVVVPSYLESGVVGATVQRLRGALADLGGRARVLVVASDGPTADAAEAAGAVVLRTGRGGKPAALNRGVAASRADVLVLTDANCAIVPDAWPDVVLDELAAWHLVSGNKTERGARERGFWALERATKRSLSRSGGSVSVVGEVMALRRADYVPVPEDTLCDDLWLATALLLAGKRVGVSDALATVEDPASAREQWERRVRIAHGLLREQVPQAPRLARTGVGRLFLGHKLYRVTVGVAGFWLAVGSAALLAPPLTLLVLPLVGGAVARYAGVLLPAVPTGTAVSAVGMQAVPVAGALRWARERRSGGPRRGGWAKVAR